MGARELNPFWFNRAAVSDFFAKHGTADRVAPPEILIELYLANRDELQRLRGVHNSLQVDCPGVLMRIAPADEYAEEFETYLRTVLRAYCRWSSTTSTGETFQTRH